jgi:MFS family permease
MRIPTRLTSAKSRPLGGVFLVANALIWYTSAVNILDGIFSAEQKNVLWSIHFSALIISLFAGVLLSKRIGRKKMFSIWTVIGSLSPLMLFAINAGSDTVVTVVAMLFGVSLGLGIPSCMSLFTDLTETKNRGRYSGLVMVVSGIGGVLLSVFSQNLQVAAITLILWRMLGLSFVFINPPSKTEPKNPQSFSYVLKQKSFILYLVPWLMFSLVGYLSVPVQSTIAVLTPDLLRMIILIENVIMGIFAVISGIIIDIVGRKRIAIIAFVIVGIEFSILGIYPEELLSWVIYTVLDGVVWGSLYVLFVGSIWGDLSQGSSTEKYYAIGILPFFLSKYLSLVLANYVAASVSKYALFSFTAFFLFLGILPLIYAPETLPEKQMKDRELKNYIEKAQKIAQKNEEINKKPDKETNGSNNEESSEEYKRATELAEKYY